MRAVSLSFRDALNDDAGRLTTIGRETFSETFGMLYKHEDLQSFLDENFTVEKQLKEIQDPEIEIRIAAMRTKTIAYAKLGPVKLPIEHDPETSLELHRLYVRQEGQGVGVGRILLTWAIEQARQRGAKSIYLGVWENNQRAISVYETRNFEKIGNYKFPVGNTLDNEVIMRKKL
ncbi:GNAT family N-acetyltransferase [Hirschia baltica]|uniref:GCN5-related N-acetyltransferase n=1 Tax=Hirschia baltica (strain ATCC 49814 / DSM 5838 / IFAM 1418) TaxID=582402 RepID=C6XNH0_HIRBI|nr:GNAT family N-acetyltransferase [Hirschia baltica]ACT60114.1 GCN5-related N-acetyltransferase [Hirschia baltica ATCC 49814]